MKTTYLLLLSTVLFFLACTSLKKENQKFDLNNKTYIITSITGTTISPSAMTIIFNETSHKISGNTGCNEYFGDYTNTNNEISFSNIGATKKYCPQISQKEKLLMNTLPKITKVYSSASNEISFKNDVDKTLIVAKLQ